MVWTCVKPAAFISSITTDGRHAVAAAVRSSGSALSFVGTKSIADSLPPGFNDAWRLLLNASTAAMWW